jgi:hypothetical protein
MDGRGSPYPCSQSIHGVQFEVSPFKNLQWVKEATSGAFLVHVTFKLTFETNKQTKFMDILNTSSFHKLLPVTQYYLYIFKRVVGRLIGISQGHTTRKG